MMIHELYIIEGNFFRATRNHITKLEVPEERAKVRFGRKKRGKKNSLATELRSIDGGFRQRR